MEFLYNLLFGLKSKEVVKEIIVENVEVENVVENTIVIEQKVGGNVIRKCPQPSCHRVGTSKTCFSNYGTVVNWLVENTKCDSKAFLLFLANRLKTEINVDTSRDPQIMLIIKGRILPRKMETHLRYFIASQPRHT